jgi:putative acetyltransferase
MDDRLRIELERLQDVVGIRAVNDSAFGQAVEGAVVDALREAGALTISLVARNADMVVGHAAFSPVTATRGAAKLLGLGPVAVLPDLQRRGIGSALIRAGLEQVRRGGFDGVVVLGHPDYYPRFGFVPASRFGLQCEYDVPSEAFMAVELVPGGLTDCAGRARYHAAFALAGA